MEKSRVTTLEKKALDAGVSDVLSIPDKVVVVKVLVIPPKDLTFYLDSYLLQSIIETALRKEGFYIADENSPVLFVSNCLFVNYEIQCLKINDSQFCYSAHISSGCSADKITKYITDSSVTIYEGLVVGFAGVKADYKDSIKKYTENELVKMLNKLSKSVTFLSPASDKK
jgi:hypothetical protein